MNTKEIDRNRKAYLDNRASMIRQRLNNSTKSLYEDILNSAFALADIWAHGSRKFQTTMPITVNIGIFNCPELNNDSTTSDDIKYRYAHVSCWEDSDEFFDLKLLKEQLEADGFVVSFDYDEIGPRDDDELYDSITASMFYDDLKKLKESKQK